ncbi:MAG TPA: response regulator [Blastocatellia bacterium]
MPKKILVVEDTVDTRELIHLHLLREGYTVIVAANGQEGLYLTSVEHPDLIITDLNMPGMDGLKMTKQLKADADLKHIPILILSALGRDFMDRAIKAGANRAVSKPVLFDELSEDVRELLIESHQDEH